MREGDNTYRLADNISDGIAGQAVNKATTDEATCDKAASDAGRDSPKGGEPDGKGVKCGIWFLSIACAMAVLVLSALTVKCVFLLRDAMALPMVLREIACAGVLVCVAAILYALYALARIFWRLPRIDQVSMTDANGKEVKASVQAKLLHGYLRNKRDGNAFPDGMRYDEYAKRILHKDECAKTLRLLSQDPIDDYGDWMEDFCVLERAQDEVASKCMLKRAGLVFVKTSVSPWRFVDVMSVLYHSVNMTTELAGIYRRRITRFQTMRLAFRGLVAVGVASVAQDACEAIADTWQTKMFDVGSKLTNGILGKIAPKAAEGSLNAALVYRLGRRMQSAFRPRSVRSGSSEPVAP